jgi:hypothetical protein
MCKRCFTPSPEHERPLILAITLFHAVIARRGGAFITLRPIILEDVMKRLIMLLIPVGILAMSGCVVAPYGYHRGYHYGPRVAVVAPVPVLVVRP